MHGIVHTTSWLTPTMVRVVLAGRGLDDFEPIEDTDAYVNVAIPPAAAPYESPFDLDDIRTTHPPELQPHRRRYTVRRFDPDRGRLTLDIVVYDGGPGGTWAAAAAPGDVLVLTGPAGGYRPAPDADLHLLAGDESALPAIAATLETLPADARAVVRVVCDGPDHELDLASPAHLDLQWLHRIGDEGRDALLLPNAIAALPDLPPRTQAFVHGEAAEIREIRRHLLATRDLARHQLSCSPYWRRHLTDEAWRTIKPDWIADVERDVA